MAIEIVSGRKVVFLFEVPGHGSEQMVERDFEFRLVGIDTFASF
jgi:hypothetical protein